MQQTSESCQREHALRQRTTCSCIAEEEEDCFTNIDKVEGKFPENVYNNTKCLEKISACQTLSSKDLNAENATVCEMSFYAAGKRIEQTQTCKKMFENSVECMKNKCNNNVKMSVCQTSSGELDKDATVCETIPFSVARDRFEKMQTCKNTFKNSTSKCLKGAAMYETTFENSKELPEVTRVCKEFVSEESPEDITVCRRMFGEPKGPPEEVIVCEALSDAKEAPKETICKKISDSNFVNQDNDKRVFLNAEDNLVKENTNSSNLNIQKKNSENVKRTIKLDNNVALNNFTGQKCPNDIKQDESINETVLNNLSKRSASVEPIKDSFSKPLSKITYSATLPQLHNHSNLNEKETWKTLVDKRKTRMQLSLNQTMRNHLQQPDKDLMAQDVASNKVDRSEEKTQEKLKEEGENQDISNERRTTEEKSKDSFLNRSVKKLVDVIKLGRMKIKERAETEKDKKITADDAEKSDIAFKNEGKISDAVDSQKISEKVVMPVKYPLTSRGKL